MPHGPFARQVALHLWQRVLQEDGDACVLPQVIPHFMKTATGTPIPWDAPLCSEEAPSVGRLLDAATCILGGSKVDVVTIDMPVSREQITSRRVADDAISREFGAAKCGTHSPSPERPGSHGEKLTRAFGDAGFDVATTGVKAGTLSCLVEVYPHPALLCLCNTETRLEYKCGKSRQYWPQAGIPDRIAKLLDVYGYIIKSLDSEIEDIHLPLPTKGSCRTIAGLKRYEDALDALVCAWVGCRYMDGHATPFGDATAAIWTPDA